MSFVTLVKPFVPDPTGSNEVGIVTERGQGQLNLFERDESTSPAHCFTNPVKKHIGTLHHASAQNYGIRRKQVHEISQPDSQIERLPGNGAQGQRVAGVGELTDTFGCELLSADILAGFPSIEPWPDRQRASPSNPRIRKSNEDQMC